MPAAVLAAIGLGANLGDAPRTLVEAAGQLARLPRSERVALSPPYRSAPLDAGGPDFINAVVLLRTRLGPHELLHELQRIEAAHGRERPFRNAPRTLDLDLLLYGDRTIADAVLSVPHPRMHERAFVLRPLSDVWPDARIPGVGELASHLLRVADQRIERLPR